MTTTNPDPMSRTPRARVGCGCGAIFGELCTGDTPGPRTTIEVLPAYQRGTAETLGDDRGLTSQVRVCRSHLRNADGSRLAPNEWGSYDGT